MIPESLQGWKVVRKVERRDLDLMKTTRNAIINAAQAVAPAADNEREKERRP